MLIEWVKVSENLGPPADTPIASEDTSLHIFMQSRHRHLMQF
jgi:hypothetical protein